MARIYGTIESLKSLKSELESNSINQFNSVREIKNFLSKYNFQKSVIVNKVKAELEKRYIEHKDKLKKHLQLREEFKKIESHKIDRNISDINNKINRIKNSSFIERTVCIFKIYYLRYRLFYIIKNRTKVVLSSVKYISDKIESNESFIKKYEEDKDGLIRNYSKDDLQNLDFTKNVLDNCKNLISGAIGENLVVKEISKLPDDYVLINDFVLNFSQPIFHKKYNQRIYSIQIDHLLISRAGIFIIETKNWSKKSVNSLSLRSPIEQIERSNFALYIYLSTNNLIKDHHWGKQNIPIRNLIVMIKNKPSASFKYVTIKLLKELNDYIKWFDPVLTDKQVNQITAKLI